MRTIADLPEFFSAAGNDWHLDLMETACKLMETPELALLQVSSDLVVAFRYHDVMELSVTREAGNMPIELLAGQSTRRQTGALRSGTEPAARPPGGCCLSASLGRRAPSTAFAAKGSTGPPPGLLSPTRPAAEHLPLTKQIGLVARSGTSAATGWLRLRCRPG